MLNLFFSFAHIFISFNGTFWYTVRFIKGSCCCWTKVKVAQEIYISWHHLDAVFELDFNILLIFKLSLFSLRFIYSLMQPHCGVGPCGIFHIFWMLLLNNIKITELNIASEFWWLNCCSGLAALWDSISVYIKPSFRDRKKKNGITNVQTNPPAQ